MSLIQTSESILQQLKELLQNLSDEQYSSTLDVFSGASIGQHTRHILEFYETLCLSASEVCYDNRKRDHRLEQDVAFTCAFIDQLRIMLPELDENRLVKHKAAFGKGKQVQLNTVESSMGRELIYAVEHAVHHMAIIKIGIITNWPSVKIAKNFGVADSTVRYKEQCAR